MATQFNACSRATAHAALSPPPRHRYAFVIFTVEPLFGSNSTKIWRGRAKQSWGIRGSDGFRGSYLDMWKKAVERERKETEFQKIVENSSAGTDGEEEGGEGSEVLEKKSSEFQKILEVSDEERDRVQRMQVIDRAAAAIAAARAILEESSSEVESGGDRGSLVPANLGHEDHSEMGAQLGGKQNRGKFVSSGNEEHELGVLFSAHAAEAANALNKVDDVAPQGIYPDKSRWWKETGTEVRPDGVVCRWTVTRGVSADKAVEWEEKYWEAADGFDYKELGSEKLGRDSAGNVWREFWKESMYQKDGFVHLKKTADKWGKNGEGNEWQEKWWESYGASGQAEKWAHKWCSIDPNTLLEAGHAHVWHERWGEQYDGQGGSKKYTDKWAERWEGDGWTKWGDKWDEHFDPNGNGVKQGETWWEGKYRERWSRTWGEGHNGSGWVHKYGKSSSGEHWDTHEEQDTWYERYPHYGFYHCFENSVQLRQVKKPSH